MSHTMNGQPFYCPPARQRDYSFDPIQDETDTTVTLAEAAMLVRAAIKRGLIKPPEKEERVKKLGIRSVWATCAGCKAQYSKDKWSDETKCPACRLERKTCCVCNADFQPTQKKQKCCSIECRNKIARQAAQARGVQKITVECAWCKKPFQKRPQDFRQRNCSHACGVQSMAAKNRKKKNENKTQ